MIGHRLLDEDAATIVALIRGGEPMAFGASDASPKAMFVHARDAKDLKHDDHLKKRKPVILVDSVVNTGQ